MYFCVKCHFGNNHRRCSWLLWYIHIIVSIVCIRTLISVSDLQLQIVIIITNIINITIINIRVILLRIFVIILAKTRCLWLAETTATANFVLTRRRIDVVLHVLQNYIRVNVMAHIQIFLLWIGLAWLREEVRNFLRKAALLFAVFAWLLWAIGNCQRRLWGCFGWCIVIYILRHLIVVIFIINIIIDII